MLNNSLLYSFSKYLNEHIVLFFYRFKALKLLTQTKQADWINNFIYITQLNLSKKSIYSFYKKYINAISPKKHIIYIINKICIKLNISFYSYLKILYNCYDLVINTLNKFNHAGSVKKYNIINALAKQGIYHTQIFKISTLFHMFIEKYLYKILTFDNNYFTLLNTLLFSEGSFIYLPAHTKIKLALGTYFHLFAPISNQFERTLLVLSKNVDMIYTENCISADYTKFNFHNAIIELILKEYANLYYMTLQNWAHLKYYSKLYGIYNLAFKKTICLNNSVFNFVQLDTGSDIIIKYPAITSLGDNIKIIIKTLNINNLFQNINTGMKLNNYGINNVTKFFTRTVNLFKTVSSYNLYINSLDKVNKYFARNECNSLLVNNLSRNMTYPLFNFISKYINIAHETIISFIKKYQILLLMQRNFSEISAYTTIIFKFCTKILTTLYETDLYNLYLYIYKMVSTYLPIISIF